MSDDTLNSDIGGTPDNLLLSGLRNVNRIGVPTSMPLSDREYNIKADEAKTARKLTFVVVAMLE
jgi:hypothetical protein